MSNDHKISRTDSTDGSERSLEIWDSISQHSGWEEWMREKHEWDDYKEWLKDEEANKLKNKKGEEPTSGLIPDAEKNLEVTIQDIEKYKSVTNDQGSEARSNSSGSLPSRFTINTDPDLEKLENKLNKIEINNNKET